MAPTYPDMHKVKGEMLKQGILIHVYFAEISKLVLDRTEKVPVFELIANVGGQLGNLPYKTRFVYSDYL